MGRWFNHTCSWHAWAPSTASVYRGTIAQERFAGLAVSIVLQVINGDFDMGSTADKVGGKANELAGKVRQGVGDAINDRDMQAKGLAQEAKGDAQQAKGKAKDAVKNVVDRA